MSQKAEVRQMLEKGEWVCGNSFLQAYIPEYRSRINEIRKDGIGVQTRRCRQHKHKGITQEWRLQGRVVIPQYSAFKPAVDPAIRVKAWNQQFYQPVETNQRELFK